MNAKKYLQRLHLCAMFRDPCGNLLGFHPRSKAETWMTAAHEIPAHADETLESVMERMQWTAEGEGMPRQWSIEAMKPCEVQS